LGRDTSQSTALIRRQITIDGWRLQYIAEVGENDEAQAEAQAEGQTKLEAATRRMLLIAFCSARLQDGVTLVTTWVSWITVPARGWPQCRTVIPP
jgi:hypothetical protein